MGTARLRPFGKSTLEVRGRWLRQQLESLEWNAGTLRHHLKNRFGISVTEAAVNNWLRGENDLQVERYLPVLFLVSSAAEHREADLASLKPYLEWLTLAGLRVAELPPVSDQWPRALGEFRRALELAEAAGSANACLVETPPSGWSERRQQQEIIHSLLQFADFRQPRYRAVILHGGSGYGKTVLARMVGCDPDIARWYVDGVFWLDCGVEAQMTIEQQLAAQWHLEADSPAFRQRLANLSAPAARCLIILDALESAGHWEWLKGRLGRQVQVLVTTNHRARTEALLHGIAQASERCALSIGGFDLSEAKQLVEAVTGEDIGEAEGHLGRLVDQVGGQPELLQGLAHYWPQFDWETLNEIVASDGLNSFLAELSSTRQRRLREQFESLPAVAQQRLKSWSEKRRGGSLHFEELARHWHLSERAVREIMIALQAQGVVDRQGDGRLRLNPSLAEVLTPRSHQGERVFESLDERQREAVRALWKLPDVKTVSLAALASLWEWPEAEAQEVAAILHERGWLEEDQSAGHYVIPTQSLILARAQAVADGRWGAFASRTRAQWLQRYWESAAGRQEHNLAWRRVPTLGESLLIMWHRGLSRREVWARLPALLWRAFWGIATSDLADELYSFEDLAEASLLADYRRLRQWVVRLNGMNLGLGLVIYALWTHAHTGGLAQQPALVAIILVSLLVPGELIAIGLSVVVVIVSTRHFQLDAWLLDKRSGLQASQRGSVDCA